ncbi:MAG: FtsX-like permease family protein [Actinomycetota bacterium]
MTRRAGSNPLWRSAPGVLLKFPALLAAVVAGAALLGLAVGSYPMFVSAASGAALEQQLETITLYGAGVNVQVVTPANVQNAPPRWSRYTRIQDAVGKRAPQIPYTDAPIFTLLGQNGAARAGNQEVPVRLASRTNFEEHIEVTERGPAEGVWIADVIAEQLGLGAGDRVELELGESSVDVPIAGVYEALFNRPATPYWRALRNVIFPPSPDAGTPPALTFADQDLFMDLSSRAGESPASFRFEIPLDDAVALSIPAAERLIDEITVFQRDTGDPESPVFAALRCRFCFGQEAPFASLLPTAVREAKEETEALQAPGTLLAVAGSLVALAVLAAVGAFVVGRRRVEFAYLSAHGMSPASLALRAAIEAFIPALLGLGVGLVVARAVVDAIGPPGPIDPGAVAAAGRLCLIAFPVMLGLLGAVTALAVTSHSHEGSQRLRRLSAWPWEIVLIIVALVLLQRFLADSSALDEDPTAIPRPGLYSLVFPILFIAGCAGLGARLFRAALRAGRDRADIEGAAAYLAMHRLAGTKGLALLLVTGATLALGVFFYARTVVTSLQDAVVTRSYLFNGSDVAAQIRPDQEIPEDFAFPATKVTRVIRGADVGEEQIDIIGLDTGTFERAAFWDDDFAESSEGELISALDRGGESLPVVYAGGELPGGQIEFRGTTIPVDVIENTPAFPGMYLGRPSVVADAERLEEAVEGAGGFDPLGQGGATTELWVRGNAGDVEGELNSSDLRPYYILSAAEVQNSPGLRAIRSTFGVLQSLGFAAGLLAVVGILLYLQTRQAGRVVSLSLSLRMGLSDRSHRRALIYEVGSMLGVALLAGAVLAYLAARLIFVQLDPLPEIPPGPRLSPAFVAISGVAIALASIAGGLVAHRSARRANVAEVMRVVG